MEAIVLAGGLGTRLQSVVNDVPKCMAPINGTPFLVFILDNLIEQGVQHIVLALGYKSEIIIEFIQQNYAAVNISVVIEEEPLGTGGAIFLAAQKIKGNHAIVLNGDSIFTIPFATLLHFHLEKKSDFTVALKPMTNFDRYGTVELNVDDSLVSFNEKKFCTTGLINAGIYIINIPRLLTHTFPQKFSFEKEYMEKYIGNNMYGLAFNNYFIDIGIPNDYEQFALDVSSANKSLQNQTNGSIFSYLNNITS
jgi:D-glycero-alpha-D-manno-heptose 1-phosphate guanylyltransferase